jgi:hypothetical protein
MSKHINCTLTDAQWEAMCDATAHHDYELELAIEEGLKEERPYWVRKRGHLDRAWNRICTSVSKVSTSTKG